MNGLIYGLLGIYLLLVGFNGQGNALVSEIKQDAKGYIPWGISVGVLAMLYSYDKTRPIAKPFIFLAILTFVLRNFPTLENNIKQIYNGK